MKLTSVTREFGDGEHVFELRLKEIRMLEEHRGVGIFRLLQRIVDQSCQVDDYRETIRLGLVGGGMAVETANKMVRDYVDDRPKAEALPVAYFVLAAVAHGIPDDLRDDEGFGENPPKTAMEGSTSPSSTAAALQ